MNMLIGSDPEVFVTKNGQLVSCHGLLPGDKKNPYPVNRGAVQVDGMAAEFNIDPAATEDDFVGNLNAVMTQLRGMLPGYEIVASPVAMFGRELIDAQPPEAKALGCEPDYNAWEDGAVNTPPNVDAPFRTGAGHVHLGWKDGSIDVQESCMFVKQLDFFLGIPSIIYDDNDESRMRRELYGKAGAFRPKTYGCEYRVLSNAWLKDEKFMRFVYQKAQQAFQHMMKGEFLYDTYTNIRQVIDNSDVDEAKRIYKDFYGVSYA
jgi:hypothetical protein